MTTPIQFAYDRAFSRNIGWVTLAEQQVLKKARIAIAGLGGVGGAHLLTLCRLGISNFTISDFDEFDVHNINRQAGAFMPFMGQSKLATMARLARDINPEADIRLFPKGVQPDNVDDFLRLNPLAILFVVHSSGQFRVGIGLPNDPPRCLDLRDGLPDSMMWPSFNHRWLWHGSQLG